MDKIIQKNISAGEGVAGRDIVKNILPHPRQMDLLSEAYKKEVDQEYTTRDIIDELTHYRNSKSDIRSLSHKLEEAGFDYLLEEAEELKELVAKLIIKNQHYKSAQKIITYLLAEVESIFNCTLKPKLKNCDSVAVKQLFRHHLEQELQDKLGENVLDIFNRQINGMVFFLTGNCHLEWQ